MSAVLAFNVNKIREAYEKVELAQRVYPQRLSPQQTVSLLGAQSLSLCRRRVCVVGTLFVERLA